jgi:hypothetical protein
LAVNERTGTVPAGDAQPFQAEPFTIAVDPGVIDDLRARIRNTRLPEAAPGQPWAQGTDPAPLIGLHLTNLELTPWTGPGSRPVSAAERQFLEQARRWDETERGYTAIQSTKPQTLGYALNDSPAGLAAWICEKWRSWSDRAATPNHGSARTSCSPSSPCTG